MDSGRIYLFIYSFLKIYFYFTVVWAFSCIYMYVHHLHAVPAEASRGHGIPWNWSYSRLCTTSWAPGTQPKPSAKVANGFKHQAISPAPEDLFFSFLNFLLICENICEFFNLPVPQFFYLESCGKVLQIDEF